MSLVSSRPAEWPGCDFEVLQNGRYRLTVREDVSAIRINDDAITAKGSAPEKKLTGKYTAAADLKLIEIGFPTREGVHYRVRVYESLTASFVAERDDITDTDLNGLKRITRVLIAQAGTATTAFVVGTQTYSSTPTLYLAKRTIEENDAYVRVTAEYLQPGVVSRTERLLDGGLKETTVRSFYTQPTVTNGTTVALTEENELGYPVWVLTALTKADGTAVTSAGPALALSEEVSFTYPGRAKPYSVTPSITAQGVSGSWTFVDVYLSPPVEASVEATTEISYSTDDEIGALANPLWNPTDWAVVQAYYYTAADYFRYRVEGLRGYRAVGSAVTGTSADPSRTTVMGEYMGFDSSYRVEVTGGPAAPDGNTYTLRYTVEAAFIDSAGTQYYRHRVTYATIPAQAALPV